MGAQNDPSRMNQLHYPGDCTDIIENTDLPLGPDRFGAFYVPVSCWYTKESNMTTVKFVGGSYADMLEELGGKAEDE